jgi:hypothetical protein
MRTLMNTCDLFLTRAGLLDSPYAVESRVSIASFQDFLSALQDRQPAITPSSCADLSALCREFGFARLDEPLAALRQSQPSAGALLLRVGELESFRSELLRASEVQHGALARFEICRARSSRTARTCALSAPRSLRGARRLRGSGRV